jgi:cytochrome P450
VFRLSGVLWGWPGGDARSGPEWRRVLDGPLTPRAVRALESAITEVVDLLIDDFAAIGQADLVGQLTEPLPAIVVGRMLFAEDEHPGQ